MKRALVIGGTRFFGKRLVARLLDEGVDVTILTRGQAADSFGGRLERLRADRTDPRTLERALGQRSWDVVFDNVCYSPDDAAAACELFDGRVSRYVHTSTQSVYKDRGLMQEEGFDPLHYGIRLGPREAFDYGEGKRLAEAVFFQRAKFPVVAARLPIVLGPDDYTGRLEFHLERVLEGRAIFVSNPEARACFISSAEAADFLHWLAGLSYTGPLNACSRGSVSIAELLALIETATGRRAIVAGQGAESDHTPFSGPTSRLLDPSRATALGFRFRELGEWLAPLVRELTARLLETQQSH